MLGQSPAALPDLLHEREPVLRREWELVEELDSQFGFDQRCDYFAGRVRPAEVEPVRHFRRAISVCPVLLRSNGLSRREVRIEDVEVGHRRVIVEDAADRVELDHVERAAGLEEARDDLGPATDVRQPADGAIGGEDDVEFFFEPVGQGVHIREYEPGLDPSLRGQRLRRLDCGFREVDAGHDCSFSGPGECIEPEVALEVEHRLAAHVS